MTGAAKPCKACGSERKVTTLGSFRGEHGPVAVIVNGMPALVCAREHKRFLCPDFVTRLMDCVADPEKFAPQPPADRSGLFSKRYYCNECGTELPDASAKKTERVLDAVFGRAAPFKVVVQVALHQCEVCGREQVLSNKEIAGSAMKALAHGFRAADVHTDR